MSFNNNDLSLVTSSKNCKESNFIREKLEVSIKLGIYKIPFKQNLAS